MSEAHNLNPHYRHRFDRPRTYIGWRLVARFCHFEIWETSEEDSGRRITRNTISGKDCEICVDKRWQTRHHLGR